MYKVILAMLVALGVSMMPSTGFAKPTYKKHHYHRHVKHTPPKKRVIVTVSRIENVAVVAASDNSFANFFTQEAQKTAPAPKPISADEVKRQFKPMPRNCAWYSCSSGAFQQANVALYQANAAFAVANHLVLHYRILERRF